MKKAQAVLQKAKERIRPGREEELFLQKTQKEISAKLRAHLPKGVEVCLCGSVAKGTALKGNRDIDLFLLFGPQYSVEEVKQKGIALAKKAMRGYKTELNYAQHPYLKVILPQVKVDIVPSSKMQNSQKLKTAVDRSQLHTVWIAKNLADWQKDEVRLLKQFLKNLGVYGAQSRVEGFSGYLCELLIVRYESFLQLLKEAAKWKDPIIDIDGLLPEEQARQKFKNAPIIVIDPTDSGRNVAAVVSRTSLSRFILASRNFLKEPALEHFFAQKEVHSAKKLQKMIEMRDTKTIVVVMPPPKAVEDVLWPQLRKTAHALMSALRAAEFRVFGHYFYADGKIAIILIEVMDEKLPALRHIVGPQVWVQKHVDAFMKKHKDAANLHVEHERVVALEKRKVRTPEEALDEALKNAQKIGIPPIFANSLKKRKYENARYLLKEPVLREIASDYYSRKL